MIYLRLFYEFFKAGLFAIGGGLATLPFLREIAGKTGWYTLSQLADMLAEGALKEVMPRSSWRASREFRLQLVEELARRALAQAVCNAGGEIHA